MLKISGNEIAKKIINNLKAGIKPEKIFAAILIGEDPVSLNFLKQKEKVAKELGVDFRIYKFPNPPAGGIKNDDLRKEIGKIALLKRVGGVIVQLPLPERINRHYILNVIPAEKDIDVLGERALGAFYTGRNPVLPPAVGVVDDILATRNLQLTTLKVAVVGLGFLVGKPIASWLMGRTAEIYLLGRGSDFSILKNADLIISGVGKAGIIKPEMLKENAGIIDFGYSIDENGKICGDFDTQLPITNYQSLRFHTPTPGGTGPILIAKIFENFYKLSQ